MNELVLYFSLKYDGDFQKIYNALMNKERVDETLKVELLNKVNCNYVTIFDDNYPDKLKEINCPPFVLYYIGNLNLVKNEVSLVTGTYTPSNYGLQTTDKVVKDLTLRGNIIINGMAEGIEKTALDSCINHSGKCIVFLRNGMDVSNPSFQSNLLNVIAQDKLILSEYPSHIPYSIETRSKTLFSNRIMAGLSNHAIVPESNLENNTMTVISYELEQQKDIYAVPTEIFNSQNGTNELIENGVIPYLNIKSIYKEASLEL